MVINHHYRQTPFRFVLKGIQRVINDEWAFGRTFESDLPNIIAAAQRKGGVDALNVFFTDGTCLDAAGFSSIPWEYGMFPKGVGSKYDVVFLCSFHVASSDFAQGTTLTHEVGHWLGLLHTFQGDSCQTSNPNDFVEDTPQQASPTEGCPASRDSCPRRPGMDAIANFMDYTNSECQDEFSPGQAQRMYDQVNEYRLQLEPCQDTVVQLEVLFDDAPNGMTIRYTDWSAQDKLVYSLMPDQEDQVNLSRQLVSRDFCIKRHALYELSLQDSNGSLQSPAYYSLVLNGQTIVHKQSKVARNQPSILLSGDASTCPATNARFMLKLVFNNSPWTIFWEIRDAKGKAVVDASSTFAQGSSNYIKNHAKSTLYFDQCLASGNYTFHISDSSGSGLLNNGSYKLMLNGQDIHQGGGKTQGSSSEKVTFKVVPTPAGLTFSFCFSGSNVVLVKNRGQVRMEDLNIGDLVHVGGGTFEPIYSFGHYSPSANAQYLFIQAQGVSLELSPDHMVYTAAKGAVPAAELKIGDTLQDGDGNWTAITSIRFVSSTGAFAPFTPSGTIVVGGALSSSFVAMDQRMVLFGCFFVSQQWLAHSFEFPHRITCYYVGSCLEESYSGNGISTWVAAPHRIAMSVMGQRTIIRDMLLLVLVLIMILFNFIESFILLPRSLLLASSIVSLYILRFLVLSKTQKKFEPNNRA
jgi:hypothetical protein